MITYTLKIVTIRKETEDTVTVCFKQPALKKVKYQAGQYLTLIFRINGRRYIRPYSFSSCPGVDSLLEITVKRVPNGIVSNHIHDKLKEGDSVETLAPMGDFVYDETGNTKQVFLWGVGSGITPLMSIVKHVLHTTQIKVLLVYGNRNHESTIFGDQLMTMQAQYPNRFEVKHFHTKMKIDYDLPGIMEGRIDQDKALNIIQNQVDGEYTVHYICGPIGLKESVKLALSLSNFVNSKVLSEDFELVRSPKDFEAIHTRNITLKFANQEYELEIIKGKSILESALDAGIELPYSCQTGNCSTCKAKLVKGESKMIGLTKDRDDLLTDEFLICCTHPLSDDVYIEIT